MIPSNMHFSPDGSTAAWTDNQDQTIEKGTQVRLRIKGVRGEIGAIYAIGSVKEDFLGFVSPFTTSTIPSLLTDSIALSWYKHAHKRNF